MNNNYKLEEYIRDNDIYLDDSTIRTLQKFDYLPRKINFSIAKIIPNKKLAQLWVSTKELPKEYYRFFDFDPKIVNFCLKFVDKEYLDIFYNFLTKNVTKMSTKDILVCLKNACQVADRFPFYEGLTTEFERIHLLARYLDFCEDNRISKRNDFLKIIAKQNSLSNMQTVYNAMTLSFFRVHSDYLIDVKRNKEGNKACNSLANKTKIVVKNIALIQNKLQADIDKTLNNIRDKKVMVENKKIDASKFFNHVFSFLLYYENYSLIEFLVHNPNLFDYADVLNVMLKARNIDEYLEIAFVAENIIVYRKNKITKERLNLFLDNNRGKIFLSLSNLNVHDKHLECLFYELLDITNDEERKFKMHKTRELTK